MSSVFHSNFSGAQASRSSSSRRPVARRSAFRAVASWLRLAPEPERRRAAPQAAPRSWQQHKHAMLKAGAKLLARNDAKPLCMAVFDVNDLPEMECVFGSRITREVVAQVVLRLQGIAGSRGLVVRTDATVFTVLMPGFDRDRAHDAIERTMGSPCCFELDADEHEIVLVPDFKVHTFRDDSAPMEQVYIDLRHAIAEAQKVERKRQRYLQLERESHTRPSELTLHTDRTTAVKLTPPVFRPMVPTMPMPIKAA